MKEHLLTTLENSRNYTLAVAEAMPGNEYVFKPTPVVWNFGEQLDHIAYGIGWWENNYIKRNKTEWSPPPPKATKKEIISFLNEKYDALKETVHKANLSEDMIKGFFATLDHITHHRAQAIVYLRCKGITAPEYAF